MKKICSFTGINRPRFAVAILAGFSFVFLYEYAVHAVLLADLYGTTPDLWRGADEMQRLFSFTLGLQLLFTIALAFLFTRNFEGKGLIEGVRFGLTVGFIFAVMAFSQYAWLPISVGLAVIWAVAALVKTVALGVLFSLLYKK